MTKIGSAEWHAALHGAVVLELGPANRLLLQGKDTRRFCNGMFTNNIRALTPGSANRSAMVEDRGRIQGFLSLACVSDIQFVALLDEGVDIPAFLERYERYVVFDDVTFEAMSFEDGPGELVSVQGPEAGAVLRGLGWKVPEPGHFEQEPFVLPQARSPRGGYDVVLARADWEAAKARLPDEIPVGGPELADALRIAAGRPRFPQDTGDKRLPHELQMREELLSFDKGCYIGQETINRVDVMGQVKRALTALRGPELPVGAQVLAEGAEVGTVTSAVALPDGEQLGLAVLKKPYDEPDLEVVLVQGEQRLQARTARPAFLTA
jgi:folate-binding protein YgfZ